MTSSKAARLRRRHAAALRRNRRLRKSGRVPQHTRTERKRAEAERLHERQAQQRRQAWQRRAAGAAVTATGIAACAYVTISVAQPVHSTSYPFWSAAQGMPEKAELPHLPEVNGTSYAIYDGPGTARAEIETRPVDPWADSVALWRYGATGPDLLD